MAIVLGIESTAHTFGVGIVKNKVILSNVKEVFTTEKGGIIPIEAANHHHKNKYEIYAQSILKSGISEKQIDAIAFSQGPGLAPCLVQGMNFAKEICLRLKKPIIPVNHCISHLEIGELVGSKDPVMLYVSGANTQVIAYEAGKYRVFGETLDLGTGNFLDSFARCLGFGFPGGPIIEKFAKKGKRLIELPYKVKGMDINLSGILTNLKQKLSNGFSKYDLCFSLQETVFAMLVEVAERALAHTGKKELLLGGGVACNKRFQEMCEIMCKERKAKYFCPPNNLLQDNGAMIAFLGEKMFVSGNKFSYKNLDKVDISPRQRTDDVEVRWK